MVVEAHGTDTEHIGHSVYIYIYIYIYIYLITKQNLLVNNTFPGNVWPFNDDDFLKQTFQCLAPKFYPEQSSPLSRNGDEAKRTYCCYIRTSQS